MVDGEETGRESQRMVTQILAQLSSLLTWGVENVFKWFMTLGEMISKAHIDCWNLLSPDLKKKKKKKRRRGEGAHKIID